MSAFRDSMSLGPVNRVDAVRRVDAAHLPPLVRDADRLPGFIPRPTAAPLSAEDVALFERLVFGDEAKPLWVGAKVNVSAALSELPLELPMAQTADRIVSTLRQLSHVRGL